MSLMLSEPQAVVVYTSFSTFAEGLLHGSQVSGGDAGGCRASLCEPLAAELLQQPLLCHLDFKQWVC